MTRSTRLMLSAIAISVGLSFGSRQAALPLVMNGQEMPTLAPVLEGVTPAVVNISVSGKKVTKQADIWSNSAFFRLTCLRIRQEQPFRHSAQSVIIDSDKGYVITNFHVIQEADEIKVTLKDGREFTAKKIGEYQQSDIALFAN